MKNKTFKILISIFVFGIILLHPVCVEASETELHFPSQGMVDAYYNLLWDNEEDIQNFNNSYPDQQLDEVAIYDINGDGIDELIFESQTDDESMTLSIYTYTDGQADLLLEYTPEDMFVFPQSVFLTDNGTLWISSSGGLDTADLILCEESYDASSNTLEEVHRLHLIDVFHQNSETNDNGYKFYECTLNDSEIGEDQCADVLSDIVGSISTLVWFNNETPLQAPYYDEFIEGLSEQSSHGMMLVDALDVLSNNVVIDSDAEGGNDAVTAGTYDTDAEEVYESDAVETYIEDTEEVYENDATEDYVETPDDSQSTDSSSSDNAVSGWYIIAILLGVIALLATIAGGILLFVVYFRKRDADADARSLQATREKMSAGINSVSQKLESQKANAAELLGDLQTKSAPLKDSLSQKLESQKANAAELLGDLQTKSAPATPADTEPATSGDVAPSTSTEADEFKEYNWLTADQFIIDEKVSALVFENSYKIYSPNGDLAGFVQQDNVSGGAAAARLLVGKGAKSMQKFRLDLYDKDKQYAGCIFREGGALSNIIIEDASGRRLVVGKLRFGSFKDDNNKVYCKFGIGGLVKTKLLDADGNQVAMINHKWNGVKSLLTTADKYLIEVSPELTGDFRQIIISVAVAYDLLMGDQ